MNLYCKRGATIRRGFDRLLDLTSSGSDSIRDILRQIHMPIVVSVARVREAVQFVAKIKLVQGRQEMCTH